MEAKELAEQHLGVFQILTVGNGEETWKSKNPKKRPSVLCCSGHLGVESSAMSFCGEFPSVELHHCR